MQEPLFMKPKLQDKIWGGTKLRDIYGYDIPSEHTGECWAISAHPDGVGSVANGEYAGLPLDILYAQHPELFGYPSSEVFPLMAKIIDAKEDLSVQVHPDDYYAKTYEDELGKPECWYIIDADEDAEIIYGHSAETKDAFKKLVDNGDWQDLLQKVKVRSGDFFFVPSGTIHAIGAGILVLETQQSSNTTYRVYDYNRSDDSGNKRDLHIQQSIAVSTIPHQNSVNHFEVTTEAGNTLTTFIANDYFTVYKWDINTHMRFKQNAPYTLVSVIEGIGELTVANKGYILKKGDHFILPTPVESWELSGVMQLIASTPGINHTSI